jgi:hypothetical protein
VKFNDDAQATLLGMRLARREYGPVLPDDRNGRVQHPTLWLQDG